MLIQFNDKIKFIRARCVQCGVCIGVCPHAALTAVYRQKTKYYDIVCDIEKCKMCGLCVQICPATKLAENTPTENLIDRAQGHYLAYARDEDVRWMSSSGGVARTLLISALSNGHVDAAYSLVYPEGESGRSLEEVHSLWDESNIQPYRRLPVRPTGEEAIGTWLTQPIPYHRIPCSLYRPVMWGEGLRLLKKEWRKVLLIGLPCQLKAAQSYFKFAHPELDILAVTILCRKQKTFGHTYYVKHLVRAESVCDAAVVYRGQGWPGNSGVWTHEGGKCVPFFYLAECWNLPGCSFCTDPLNAEFSDLTVGDPWKVASPSDDTLGQNLLIVWSHAGKDFLAGAADVLVRRPIARELVVKSLDFRSIGRKDSQARLYAKKKGPVRVWQFLRIFRARCAEWLTMHFTHYSRLFQSIQSIKITLVKLVRRRPIK